MKELQYRKKGLALIFLAKKFFLLKVGDRIPTIDEFCQESNMSRGTIQSALNILKSNYTIKTVSKGHLGSYLVYCNQNKLLDCLDNRNFVCAMPLPYTKRYEGLATSFYKFFKDQQINFSLAYVNGSLARLEGLLNNRYNFIITSQLTANYILETNNKVQLIDVLPPKTYLSEHVLIFKKGNKGFIRDNMSIGIDTNSIDYVLLTKEILQKHHVKIIETPYNQIVKKVENNQIDAAIWNFDEIRNQNYKVDYRMIDSSLVTKGSSAALLCKRDNNFVKAVIKGYIDVAELVKVQNEVINGKILPEY